MVFRIETIWRPSLFELEGKVIEENAVIFQIRKRRTSAEPPCARCGLRHHPYIISLCRYENLRGVQIFPKFQVRPEVLTG